MELHNLKPAPGSVKKDKKVVGRGQGSGKGGTSTRGHKGAQSRAGYKSKRNYEGGQTPLQMRLPKRGFNNKFRVEYVPLNVERLQEICDKYSVNDITLDFLTQTGIINLNDRVKVLGGGELSAKLSVTVHKCTDSAKEKIEKAGGSVTLV